MKTENQALARHCLAGAEADTVSFPEAVGLLAAAGFDGYLIDYRRGTATYYHQSGDALDLPAHASAAAIAAEFDAPAIQAAIRDAQMLVAGYTYRGFCDRVRTAGCAGYMVSIPGRRVLYFGRTAETHVELFPSAGAERH